MMEGIQTHPANAAEAKDFTESGSLSLPDGIGQLSLSSTGTDKANGQQADINGAQKPQSQLEAQVTGGNGPTLTLVNTVSTVNLDCRLDLKTIALYSRNSEYNRKRFHGLVMRIREPKSTALIFATGKMIVTGARSEADSRLAARKFARVIQKVGYKAKFKDFKIQNLIGSSTLNFRIDLGLLASNHYTFSSYEPELFPGLIYRMVKPKIVLMIFATGKIAFTGAKVRQDINQAFEMICPLLQDFRKLE